MFSSINYTSLRNSEFIQFFQNLLDLLSANDPEVLKLKSEFYNLEALVATLASFFKPELGSEITSELQELDAARDAALQGIELQVKSFTYHYTQSTRVAAELLNNSLENYGSGIGRLNYQAETSTINSIIEKWEKEQKFIDALTTLNLSSWLGHMKGINTNFNQRFLDRLEDNVDSPEQSTLELRAEIIISYRQLMSFLQAYTTLSTSEEYTKVNKLINELITQYNLLVSKRTNNKDEIANQEDVQ